jgi:hypothetical protein
MGKRVFSDETKILVRSLHDSGLGYRKIGELTGVSLGLIGKIVKSFDANKDLVTWYEKNKITLLRLAQLDNLAIQEAIRNSITAEEIQTWTPDQRARWYSAAGLSFAILFDKERLQADMSTENVNIIVRQIRELKQAEAEEDE